MRIRPSGGSLRPTQGTNDATKAKIRRTDWLPVRDTKEAMDQDQLHRSDESASDYDSEEEEAMVIPRPDSDRSDYVDSDAGSEADYAEQRDLAFSQRDYDELSAEYNFEFTGTGRGLPVLSDVL